MYIYIYIYISVFVCVHKQYINYQRRPMKQQYWPKVSF